MGKKQKNKPRDEKAVASPPTQPQGSTQVGPGPSISSGSSGRQQQQQRSQAGQGWGGQRAGRHQQPLGQVDTWSTQTQRQRPQGQHGSSHQGGPGRQPQREQQRHNQQQPQGPQDVNQASGPPQQQDASRQGQDQGLQAVSIKRGTIGTPGQVEVNYLKIDMEKMPEYFFHYDVKIQPERLKKFYREAFEQFRVNQLGGLEVSFDGKASCYSVDRLPTNSQNPEVTVKDSYGRCLRYTVEIKETADPVINFSSLKRCSYASKSISDKPLREMQCMEVVLASPCHRKSIRAGRSFYPTSGTRRRRELDGGYEVLVGLFQAIVLGDRPCLNVDISHKSFPIAMPVLDWLQKYGPKKEVIDQETRPTIESFLKGLNVVYKPPKSFATMPRCYKVNGLSPFPAHSEKFQLDGKEITVADFFKNRNYKLKYPQLHCLHVGPPAKKIMLPIELCDIEGGQVLKRKDGVTQVTQMIRYAATSTGERKAKIMNLLKFFQHNLDPTISRFGIRIASDFIVVKTRTLAPPELEYHNNTYCSVTKGTWRMNNMCFLEPKQKAHKWAILYLKKMSYYRVDNFAQEVLAQAKKLNVCLDNKPKILDFWDERDLDKRFECLLGHCDLAFVIMTRNGVSYGTIKQKAELQHGILTQCIKKSTIEGKLDSQIIFNILLKVNLKLNGINHKLKEVMLNNVMFLGADVTHPSPDQRDIPSVVGVVASHDPYGAVYNNNIRLQRSTLEVIEDMESIALEHLRVYKEYRKAYPEHIIYFRDGVDDGQFPKIKSNELRGIRAACAKLDIEPKICCIIVVKRHHTRFFPTQQPARQFNNSKKDYNNVEPGTVVDSTIVHPNEVQFFMVSHSSFGTARPTRYNVIENAGELDINLLQRLTYNLCYMYPRCNRAVSYPAPAYVAHQAAKRGRAYLTDNRSLRDLKTLSNFKKTYPMYFI